MKILLLDIEVSPVLATVWGLFNQNIAINQIIGESEVLTWAAKWYKGSRIMDGSLLRDGKKLMLARMHSLTDEADAVVTWNGDNFDLKVLRKEYMLVGSTPPTPAKSVDLLQVARKQFRFTSNKMDYVAQRLGLGKKLAHPGHQMWLDCMNRKPAAFKKMLAYNRQDVVLLEGIYDRFMPWIPSHPNHSVYSGVVCCPNCGSEDFTRNGWAFTQLLKYPRFKCRPCGKYFRSNKSVSLKADRVIAVQ